MATNSAQWLAEKREEGLAPNDPRHGRAAGYQVYGCRCESCRSWKRGARDREDKKKRNLRARYARYSLTATDYEDLWDSQGRVCAACGSSEPGAKRGWHIDHNHQTGAVRGILCHGCNVGFGSLGDDIKRVEALLAYAKLHLG